MDNIYIYQQRSQGHFNRVIQPILATAMTAWRGEGEFELVLRNVVNSGLRAHFERAGLQKIPVVDFTQDGLDIPVPREAASYKLIIPLQD